MKRLFAILFALVAFTPAFAGSRRRQTQMRKQPPKGRKIGNVEETKGTLMKNSITRALMIAMLATSMSAFAASDKPKTAKNTNDKATTTACPVDQTIAAQGQTQLDERKPDAQQQQLIKQQEKDWLNDVTYNR